MLGNLRTTKTWLLCLGLMAGLSGCATVGSGVCQCQQHHGQCCPHAAGQMHANAALPPMQSQLVDQSVNKPQAVPVMESTGDYGSSRTLPHLPPAPEQPVASCDEELNAARTEFEAKLHALEARFEAEQKSRESVETSLKNMNREVTRLTRDVEYYRGELTQVARTADRQHREDMAALDALSDMIHQMSPSVSHASGTR